MTYKVKEIFKTIQGEGARAGDVAVFCRFSGCNLWSGREKDRARAVCQFCDTDFVGGKRYTLAVLMNAIEAAWGAGRERRRVVFTGGEPLLQLDKTLIEACHDKLFSISVETNGTVEAPKGIHWLCVSPKAGSELVQTTGDELKLVYPQPGVEPSDFTKFGNRFRRYSLQPMDGPQRDENTQAAIAYCIANPHWSLSLQTHKWAGIR